MTTSSAGESVGADPGDDDVDSERPEHDSTNPALEDEPDPDEPPA
jgi:hypothetical protein